MFKVAAFLLFLSSFLPHAASPPPPSYPADAYWRSIEAYIGAVHEKDKISFDTLFIGKHPDFPDIRLPSSIGGIKVLLLTSAAADQKLAHRKSMTYLNIMGTVQKEKAASFLVVTFRVTGSPKRGTYKPQHNCHIDLIYNARRKTYVQQQLRFEYPYPKNK